MRCLLAAIALGASVPVSAQVWTTEPKEPAAHPEWGALAREVEATIFGNLSKDPAPRIEWIQGFAWGSMKHVIGGRDYGWVACGAVVKPKKSGGESRRQFSVMANPDGSITFGYAGKVHSSCWTRDFVPIPPEMVEAR